MCKCMNIWPCQLIGYLSHAPDKYKPSYHTSSRHVVCMRLYVYFYGTVLLTRPCVRQFVEDGIISVAVMVDCDVLRSVLGEAIVVSASV